MKSSQAKRILLITGIFPPQIGGPATFNARLAERMALEHGYQVTVICATEDPTGELDKARPYTVRRLFGASLRSKVLSRFIMASELMRHDQVLINGLDTIVYSIAHRLRRPYMQKIVGDSIWEMARSQGRSTAGFDEFQQNAHEQKPFAGLVKTRNKRVSYPTRIITPSEYLKGVVMGWGVDASRITVIPNGAELGHFAQLPPRPPKQDDMLNVLFVGRLMNWKGVETLLLAAQQLERIRVTIVGDGIEYPMLRGLAAQLNLGDRVEFTGRLTPAQVEERMGQSDVLVLTSLYEGLSHTLLEAMACGLACVASARCGNAELIESGKNGLLVEPQNVEQLAAALRQLQENPQLRAQISEAAKQTSAHYDIENTVQGYVDLFLRENQESTRS